MKKRTIILLIIAFSFIIIGSIGSAIYFPRVETKLMQKTEKSYPIKNQANSKAITLNLLGNASYKIETGNIDKVSVVIQNKEELNISEALKVSETNQNLVIDINAQEKIRRGLFNIEFLSFFHPEITIVLPHNVEKLDIKSNNSNITLKQSLKLQAFRLNNTNGDSDLADITTKKFTVLTNTGTTTLEKINGDINAQASVGDITIMNSKGNAHLQTTLGDINLSGRNMFKNLAATTTLGDIKANFDTIAYDISLKADTTGGGVMIFDKKRNNYQQGEKKQNWLLKTNLGDITVDGPVDSDDLD